MWLIGVLILVLVVWHYYARDSKDSGSPGSVTNVQVEIIDD